MNLLKNLNLKKGGMLAVLFALLITLVLFWHYDLLNLPLTLIGAIGCITFIALNIQDHAQQVKKGGEALIAKADALFKKGELKGAMRDYNKALTMTGPSWAAYLGLGHCYRSLDDYKKCMEYAKMAIDCKGDSAAALYLMGICLFRQDYYDSALKHLEKALQANPDLADALMLMGEIYAAMVQKDEAIKCFNKYLEKCKDEKVAKSIRERIEKLSSQKPGS